MVKRVDPLSQWARNLGMSPNELRFLTQLVIGQMLDAGESPQLTRYGRALVYDDALKARVRAIVPTFLEGKKLYLED